MNYLLILHILQRLVSVEDEATLTHPALMLFKASLRLDAFVFSGVATGGASAPPQVLFCRKFGQNLKIFGQKISTFLNNTDEITFGFNECINNSSLCYTKHLDLYIYI